MAEKNKEFILSDEFAMSKLRLFSVGASKCSCYLVLKQRGREKISMEKTLSYKENLSWGSKTIYFNGHPLETKWLLGIPAL